MKTKLFIAFFAAMFFPAVFSLPGQTQVLTQNNLQNASKLPFQNLMFSDVDSSHENFDAIYFLYNTNVIEGYAQGSTKKRDYKPDIGINRAEFLKLFLEGTGKASNAEYEKCFPDVDPKEWYATYICQAKEKGWVNGYSDGSFKPAQLINEVESLKILGEILDWTLPKLNEEDDWFEPYLNVASSRKIVPEDDISSMMTRGDIAEMIFRNTQVESLKVPQFDKTLIDNLFYEYDIPFGGPLGPGGIFGPGGLFGNAGAFYSGGPFVGPGGEIKILDNSYYNDNYCYYSDSGDFMEIVQNIFIEYAGGDEQAIEDKGYDVDGFGVMFCYDEPVETDLVLFTEESQKEFGVTCWGGDELNAYAAGNYEQILCYVEPSEPEWVGDETYCVEDYDSLGNLCETCYEYYTSDSILSHKCSEVIEDNDNGNAEDGKGLKVSVYGLGDISVGEETNINVIIDRDGKPVTEEDLVLYATTGRDYEYLTSFAEEKNNGVYKTTFSSTLAGDFNFIIKDKTGEIYEERSMTVFPGNFDHINVLDIGSSSILVSSVDKYGNTLPYSPVNNDISATTTIGQTSVTYDENGVFTIDVSSSQWGEAEVTIVDKKTSTALYEPIEIGFFPLKLDAPKGINKNSEIVEVPLNIFFPSQYGTLGSYDIKLGYDSSTLQFLNVIDRYPDDSVKTPLFDVDSSTIRIWQPSTGVNDYNPENVPVGTLLFNVVNVGGGTIHVQDLVLKDQEGGVINYVGEFVSGAGDAVSNKLTSLSEDFWKWWYNIKDVKDFCVDVFLMPGTTADEGEVASDIAKANLIFAKIADSCNCGYYINFVLNKVTTLTAAEFAAIDADGDGSVTTDGKPGDGIDDEIDVMMRNHPASGNCIPVYYPPKMSTGGLGLSRNSDTSNGVLVDDSKDFDDKTLAHELAHQLSKGAIVDPNKPKSGDQGADDAGNLMNYDDTGDVLTKKQCEEIEKIHP